MKNSTINFVSCALIAIALFISSTTMNAQGSPIRAKQYAQNVAEQLMSKTCPLTGSNAQAYITDAEYDSNTGQYLIEMTANWTGRTWAFGADQSFEIRGFLTVDRDGTTSFRTTYQNRAVLAANSNYRWAVGTAVVLAAASSNNQ
jgi:hypothetical protein